MVIRRRADARARAALGVNRSRFRLVDGIRQSAISVLRNPGRSVMTSLGTLLGAAGFVATLGIASTAQRQVADSFDLRRATEVMVLPEEKSMVDTWQRSPGLDRLRGLNGVEHAGRRIVANESAVTRALGAPSHAMKIMGADPGALAAMDPHLVTGRVYDAFHERIAAPVVLLPKPLATELRIDRVGIAVFINDRPFTVAGIFDDVTRRPEALLAVVMPASTAETFVRSEDGSTRDIIIQTVPGASSLIAHQASMALWPQEPTALRVYGPPDPKTLRREIEGDLTRSSLLLSVIMLLVGTISIANAAIASITARVPEIGLRRAVGGRPRHIFAQLLGETTVLGGFGGMLGAAVGITVVAGVCLYQGWSPVLDLRAALVACGGSALAGALAGLWPAARATGIQPVDALQR